MNAKRFLNGFVLVFLVTLGILCLPPVRTRVEKTLYPCKYSALVEQYAAEYDLDPLLVYSFVPCRLPPAAARKARSQPEIRK